MAARKKKTKTTLLPRVKDRWPAIPWPETGRILCGGLWVIGLGAIGASWFLGVPRLQAYVEQVAPPVQAEVTFVDPPAWMNGDLAVWLTLIVQQQLESNPLDRTSLDASRRALMETGCFEDVRQVRRASPSLIEVDAAFLQPFAVVVDEDGEHLIDPHGRLLPSAYRVGKTGHFIRIVGTLFDRPVHPGLQWDGADLTAALHLIRLIDDHEWWLQISAIDVSEVDTIGLLTRRNCHIIWGAAPGEEAIGEVTAEQKISRLDYIDVTFGRIDIDCPNELDITDPKVVTAR